MIFPALYFIETVGRRKSLLIGAVLEAVSPRSTPVWSEA